MAEVILAERACCPALLKAAADDIALREKADYVIDELTNDRCDIWKDAVFWATKIPDHKIQIVCDL